MPRSPRRTTGSEQKTVELRKKGGTAHVLRPERLRCSNPQLRGYQTHARGGHRRGAIRGIMSTWCNDHLTLPLSRAIMPLLDQKE